jgi:NTE family protein
LSYTAVGNGSASTMVHPAIALCIWYHLKPVELVMTIRTGSALVLQGGGALGAYELGAARCLYKDPAFKPDIIAGVSIGAVTTALLARPAQGMDPLEALEKFWKLVTVQGWFMPPPFREYASLLGNPKFFVPRRDLLNAANWIYIYETAPLRETLAQLVDIAALGDRTATPRVILSATNIAEGHVTYFDSTEQSMTLDHVLASGSLPPAFPPTLINEKGHDVAYWDGGLSDNTPLGPVIDCLADVPAEKRIIFVVNLFPNKAPVPTSFAQVNDRQTNLQFANRTESDLKLMRRFNEVAALMKALEALPPNHPVYTDPAFDAAFSAVKRQRYIEVPRIVEITKPDQVEGLGFADFSPETIALRAAQGYAEAEKKLAEAGIR